MLGQVLATPLVHGRRCFFEPTSPPALESKMFDATLLRPAVLALRPLIAVLLAGLPAGRGAVRMPTIAGTVNLEVAAAPGALHEVVFQVPSAARETGLRVADVPSCRRFPQLGSQQHQGVRVPALAPSRCHRINPRSGFNNPPETGGLRTLTLEIRIPLMSMKPDHFRAGGNTRPEELVNETTTG